MKLPVISLAILAGQLGFAHAASGGNVKETLNNFQSFYTGIYFGGSGIEWGDMGRRLAFGYVPWVVKRFAMAVAKPRLPIRGLPISLS